MVGIGDYVRRDDRVRLLCRSVLEAQAHAEADLD